MDGDRPGLRLTAEDEQAARIMGAAFGELLMALARCELERQGLPPGTVFRRITAVDVELAVETPDGHAGTVRCRLRPGPDGAGPLVRGDPAD